MKNPAKTAFATLSLSFLAACGVAGPLDQRVELDLGLPTATTFDFVAEDTRAPAPSPSSARLARKSGLAVHCLPRHDRSTGRVLVRSSADGTLRFSAQGNSAGDRFGWSVEIVGDVDRDGTPDLAIGAPLDDDNGNASGSVFILSGRDGRQLHVFRGDAAGHQLGYSVAFAGDINRDGHADIRVGAPFANQRSGLERTYCGKTGRVLRELRGTLPGQRIGKKLP